MGSLEEMDKFLEKYNFWKLNQKEIEDPNRSITSVEIETVIRNLPANKSPGPAGYTAKTWFFEKIHKIDKLLPRVIKKQREKNKSRKLEMKMEKSQQTTQEYKGS